MEKKELAEAGNVTYAGPTLDSVSFLARVKFGDGSQSTVESAEIRVGSITGLMKQQARPKSD